MTDEARPDFDTKANAKPRGASSFRIRVPHGLRLSVSYLGRRLLGDPSSPIDEEADAQNMIPQAHALQVLRE